MGNWLSIQYDGADYQTNGDDAKDSEQNVELNIEKDWVGLLKEASVRRKGDQISDKTGTKKMSKE